MAVPPLVMLQLKVARANGFRASKKRRIPRQSPPTQVERAYAGRLYEYVDLARDVLAPAFAELPSLIDNAAIERADSRLMFTEPSRVCHWCRGKGDVDAADARRLDVRPGPCGCSFRLDAGEAARVGMIVDLATKKLNDALDLPRLEALAGNIARDTAAHQRSQLQRQIRSVLGVDVLGGDASLRKHVQGFVVENVALIKDIPARIVRDVELASTRAVASGTRWEVLAKDLEARFGYGRDRAKLIARDQVGKLNGQINAQRQRDIGVRRFIWRTMNDERVRDDHEHLADEIFEYDNPPAEGLPGEPIQCRCYAEPMLEDILSELEAELDEEEAA